MSIVILATLIFLSPIFICLLLFQLTKEYFDRWWKNILSMGLQPAVVFSVIGIFNLLIIVALNNLLAFETRKEYLFDITLPDWVKYAQLPGGKGPYYFFPYCKAVWPDDFSSYTDTGSSGGGTGGGGGSSETPPDTVQREAAIGGGNSGLSNIGTTLKGQAGATTTGSTGTSENGATPIFGNAGGTAPASTSPTTAPPSNTYSGSAQEVSDAKSNYDTTEADLRRVRDQEIADANARYNSDIAAGVNQSVAQQQLDRSINAANQKYDAGIQTAKTNLDRAANNSWNNLKNNTGTNAVVYNFTDMDSPLGSAAGTAGDYSLAALSWVSNALTSVINIIVNALTLLILVHCMYIFVQFAPNLVVRIVTGMLAQQMSITSGAESMMTHAFGLIGGRINQEYKGRFASSGQPFHEYTSKDKQRSTSRRR